MRGPRGSGENPLSTTSRSVVGLRDSWLLPAVLSTTAGAVDVVGFLALGGLFTAHITGNVVVVAAHYITGGSCQIGPLVALPVFVAVLGAVTVASVAIERAGYGSFRGLMVLHAGLLAGCLGLGVAFGPFADADRPMAVLVGMLAVAAMATQNAFVKLALPGAPSTAVMTTNTTQLIVDLCAFARQSGEPDDLARARRRASLTFPYVVGFVAGCAAGAALEVHFGLWALVLPALLAVLAVALGERELYQNTTVRSRFGPAWIVRSRDKEDTSWGRRRSRNCSWTPSPAEGSRGSMESPETR